MRGFIDDENERCAFLNLGQRLNPRSCAASSMTTSRRPALGLVGGLNPRSCAASSMTEDLRAHAEACETSQSAFVRGFIDDTPRSSAGGRTHESQSAFVRGFIDDRAS